MNAKLLEKLSMYAKLAPLDVLQRYTIPEAALYLRQSVASTYQQIADGSLRISKQGVRSYVTGQEIARASGTLVEET